MDLNNLLDPLNVNMINQVMGDLQELEEDVLDQPDENVQFVGIDPFETLSGDQFQKVYRLSKPLVIDLIELLQPYMKPPKNEYSLSLRIKVLMALHFYASGSYQAIIGSSMFYGVSQSSMSRTILEVALALNHPNIFDEWVSFPQNMEQLNSVSQRLTFFEKYAFPGIVGCIDCTHVAIVRPMEYEHVYVNRKTYSINVQLICDDNLRILNINARFPGSAHDTRIWNESHISNLMEEIHNHHPNKYHLLGDSGYPTRPWLLTPIQNPHPGSPEERYNNAQMSIRSLIERCNGVLKNGFRCLLKHRVLHYSPERASLITNACVVLHNMCIAHNVQMLYGDGEEEVNGEELGVIIFRNDANGQPAANPGLAAGLAKRRHIIQTYF